MKNFISLTFLSFVFTFSNAQTFQYEWGGINKGIGLDYILDMDIDANNNIFTTGYFTDISTYSLANGAALSSISANGDVDIFVQKTEADGSLVWLKKFGTTLTNLGTSIKTDHLGNIYVAGGFMGEVPFDSGNTSSIISNGLQDAFLMKLNSEGETQWAISLGGNEFDEATTIDVDEIGNIYVAGYFSGTVDFDPTNDEFSLTSQGDSISSISDTFIAKYSPDGSLIWAKNYDDFSPSSIVIKLLVTPQNEILILGSFEGTIDFDPNQGVAELSANAPFGADAYLLKLTSEGEFKMVTPISRSQSNNVYPSDIKLDSEGNIYTIGSFSGAVDFDASSNETLLIGPPGTEDTFISKINSAGSLIWAKQYKSDKGIIGYGIELDDLENIYTVGYFGGITDFDPDENTIAELNNETINPFNAFLTILDKNGNFISASQFGGSNFIRNKKIKMDAGDNIYITGTFENQIDLNPSLNAEDTISSIGFRDSYIIKLRNEPNPTSINNPKHTPQNIKIYPNPIDHILTIESDFQKQTFILYDILGHEIKSGNLSGNQSTIDLSLLHSGTYFLKIDNKSIFKIIKN